MITIIGLGNPGSEYQKTRHNVGFTVVEKISKELQAPEFKFEKKFNAEISSTSSQSNKILIAKPHTFMNLSGEAVQAIIQFYKIDPTNVWVVYDDVDLPLGEIRIRKNGSPGTHNGMKSISHFIGQDFPRIRIGIESRGTTAPEQQDTSSFVLAPFLKDEESTVQEVAQKATEALKVALREGIQEAMNQFN